MKPMGNHSFFRYLFFTLSFFTATHFLAFASGEGLTLEDLKLNFSGNFKIINEKKGPDFKVDLSKLKNGDVQHFMSFTEAEDFDDEEVLTLDRYRLKEVDERAMFIVTKMAYIMKGRNPEFFNAKLFNSPHYIRSTFVDTEASESGTPNLVKVSRLINVGPINIGRVNFDLLVEELNEERDREFVQRALDFDQELGTPVNVSALYMTNADKMLNGTYVINKYYRVNNQGTLVVSFQFSSVKKVPLPFFIIRNQAMKSALSEAKIFVKSLREFEMDRP